MTVEGAAKNAGRRALCTEKARESKGDPPKRVAGQDQAGVVGGDGDQVAVGGGVGQAIGGQAALAQTQRVAAAAQFNGLTSPGGIIGVTRQCDGGGRGRDAQRIAAGQPAGMTAEAFTTRTNDMFETVLAAAAGVILIGVAGCTSAPSTTVTIVRGDTLWDLSEDRIELTIDGDASPRETLEYLRVVIDANPDVVEDPNLIFPVENQQKLTDQVDGYLGKGGNITFLTFQGVDHMNSARKFFYIKAARDWLFKQVKA